MENESHNSIPRRFLFSASGGSGHLHPLVPLAQALIRAKHEVAFAVGTSLQPMVEALGFTVFPAAIKMSDDPEYQQVKAQQEALPSMLEREVYGYPRLFCGIGSRLRTPRMVEICRDWQPDMLIRDAAEYSAAVAAEYLGLPHATVSFAASLKGFAIFEREVTEQLDPVRHAYRLAPDPNLNALYRYLVLTFSPPTFSMQDIDATALGLKSDIPTSIPATTHFIKPEIFDNAGNETLPGWAQQLPATGQPTVYVTLGTVANSDPDIYPSVLQTIISGLRDLPINLIVTLGRECDPADFGPQPANVHIERYIPQSLLLPMCDLMVMHGGSNSVLAALDAGIPVIVVPLLADQFFNADIIHRLKLGEVVQREQLTPAVIRASVETVLHGPIYKQNVARQQAEMNALPVMSHAVALVEKAAAERISIPGRDKEKGSE